MSQCPLCGRPVKDDFGLVECECGAQLMIHDGKVEYQGANVAEFNTSSISQSDEVPEFREPAREFDYSEEESPIEPVSESPLDQSFTPDVDSQPVESLSASTDESDLVEDPVDSLHSDPGTLETPPPVYISAASPDSGDLGDVANFGNSDLAGARAGALRYNVIIEGIDTLDVRNDFNEAITDARFMWDKDEILRSIRSGQVTIQNMSAVKAYMLISRLRDLPVQVRWEQYAVHQT